MTSGSSWVQLSWSRSRPGFPRFSRHFGEKQLQNEPKTGPIPHPTPHPRDPFARQAAGSQPHRRQPAPPQAASPTAGSQPHRRQPAPPQAASPTAGKPAQPQAASPTAGGCGRLCPFAALYIYTESPPCPQNPHSAFSKPFPQRALISSSTLLRARSRLSNSCPKSKKSP